MFRDEMSNRFCLSLSLIDGRNSRFVDEWYDKRRSDVSIFILKKILINPPGPRNELMFRKKKMKNVYSKV